MIIIRTPFRISFLGGGTDYPAWYNEHGGAVLATTINKYCYLTCRKLPPFFEHRYRLVYSNIETVKYIDDIQHPAVKAVLQWSGEDHGLEIHHDGDLPARSGLGSSSSFTVSLVHAMRALNGQYATKESLAKDAINIEQNIIKENVGSQDQISAAYGGFNRIEFKPGMDGFRVEPVLLSKERRKELQDNLMLCFTGFSRIASEIASSKIANMKNRVTELHFMKEMVDEGIQILHDKNTPIEKFGELLHQSWQYKRGLSNKVSTLEIDALYETARANGATGGKILGAGGGGFLLLFVRPEFQDSVRESLNKLIHVPFQFEDTGSRVVLYQPDGLS